MGAATNRFHEMDVFVRVVAAGGFSAAARAVGMTPSAVSKLVARLEARLGVQLVNRTIRAFQLTAEGSAFHERARAILDELADAERGAGAEAEVAGRVRINTSATYLVHVLAPALPAFLAAHPELEVDIDVTDRVVDLYDVRADIGVRAGPLASSELLARRLGSTKHSLVAAPTYLEAHGVPRSFGDLDGHRRIGFGYVRAEDHWPLRRGDTVARIAPEPQVRASDGEGIRRLALAGAGIARLAEFAVRGDLTAGRLVVIPGFEDAAEPKVFHAVHMGRRGLIPARVEAVLDFLAREGRVAP